MNIWEWVEGPRAWAVLAGVAGAAAMAVTDWQSPARFLQHMFVGSVTASVATEWTAPAISKILGLASVDPSAHPYSAAFITGAFGIYALEFILAFWRRRSRSEK